MPNSWDPDIYSRAWDYATLAHEGQTYGGAEEGVQVPYINHVASVAMEVVCALIHTDEQLDANLAVQCALLHDVVEDTSIGYHELVDSFGLSVADGVQALTKDFQLTTKREQMADSVKRIQQQPKEIWIVKLADRVSNLYRPPFFWDQERISYYRDESQFILSELGECNAILHSRLRKKIEEYGDFLR
ncbi:HD domain-containing protein [Teredinibacter sp. KSP-S5-2]|uniref:HD domain-containing protein n=1 Tax=Teredinibacter sp. KSP-S5-2 TaxID=3034506 RepID=UPI0029342DC8|nr:HD domain-containing protein [Teredinibacter sp. KSP-S5-2]WNO11090.1 HD domain-containing protein [Teredinibacter sp. KSP-S5-2]